MPFLWGQDPLLTQRCLGRGIYTRTTWHLDPSNRLNTIDMGRKLVLPFFFWGERGPNLTQFRLGRDLPPYQVAS